ncbi:unnamed protein product [Macrosiphum euphorbiae]|uniref:THAP-type domain-containing protein n=1 Tax=Macrosiphum euphorbiae TaxID=13131 RepID=A0AAV0VLK9_9HEMI|nr:unnamed protein product [Macrosiphum euphorbiae]
MPSCLVCGRTNNAKAKSANITFHRFPLKDTYKNKWYNFLGENGILPDKVSKTSLVCSAHFDDSFFVMGKDRRLLLKHAIPTKIINRIKCAKQQYSETVTNLPVIKTFYTSSASDSVDNIASLNVTRTLVKCPLSNIEVDGVSLLEPVQSSSSEEEGVLPLDNSSVSMMNCETITPNKNISYVLHSSTMSIDTEIVPDDTPRKIALKKNLRQLSHEVTIKNIKMKTLQQKIRRQNKRISSMKNIISELQKQNLIDEEASYTLSETFGKHKDLITNWTKKKLGKKVPKKYSATIRQFALSLHFFSAKAYSYVRQQFDTILPHSRTLSKWYRNVNAEPGFTEESLKMLTLKVNNSPHPILLALSMDEMAIRQHLEFDGTKYYGRVDMGNYIDNDSLNTAKQCLVFMAVSVNENWKLPIGYFVVDALKSAQKVELVRHALNVLDSTGVKVLSLTFDGCSSNISAAQLLGCNYVLSALDTSFSSGFESNPKIVTLFDPAHMIKLVRNAFGEKKVFKDSANNEIKFEYVRQLCYLQEKEGCHLANKLRKQHLLYFKQKMKVKLATQLLSQSVADALTFCKDSLKLKEFSNAGATIQFIELFNTGFDILNSKSINCVGFKKALCEENIQEVRLFTEKMTTYIKGLKIQDRPGVFTPVLESQRKTGTNDIQSFNTGNCIPLEEIDILHYSSSDPVTVLNNNSSGCSFDPIDEENEQDISAFIMDHDYIGSHSSYSFSNFSKEIIVYISGFVVHKLTNVLKCDVCKHALCAAEKECFLNSLITLKNKGGIHGGLIFPSEDVIDVCFITENILRRYDYTSKAVNKLQVQTDVLKHFVFNSNIFKSLKNHSTETRSPLADHTTLLIKSISSTYINIKINYSLKKHNEPLLFGCGLINLLFLKDNNLVFVYYYSIVSPPIYLITYNLCIVYIV